jgi:hypothetical protein
MQWPSLRMTLVLMAYAVLMFVFFRNVSRRQTGVPDKPTPSSTASGGGGGGGVGVAGVINSAPYVSPANPSPRPRIEKSPLPPCDTLPLPAIVVLTFNRPAFLERTMQSLLSLPRVQHYTIYVSQDGSDRGVDAIATSYAEASPTLITHWVKPRPQSPSAIPVAGYVAQHYKWVLDRIFVEQGHSHAIIVEDDMEFA